MRRVLLTGGFVVISIVALTTLGFAQKSGAHLLEEPVCTLSGDTIICEGGSAAGLGNQPVTVSADVPAGCEVRPGTNEPRGHAQEESEPIQPRGGRINFPTFNLTADCPSGLNPTFGDEVTYTILNGDGVLVLTFTVEVTT
jgi:hypothetical protein